MQAGLGSGRAADISPNPRTFFYLSATPGLTKYDLRHHACQDNKVAILEFFQKVGGHALLRLREWIAKIFFSPLKSSEGFRA